MSHLHWHEGGIWKIKVRIKVEQTEIYSTLFFSWDPGREPLLKVEEDPERKTARVTGASAAGSAEKQVAEPHREIECRGTKAEYFDPGEALVEIETADGSLQMYHVEKPLLYLRLIPGSPMPNLTNADMKELVYGINILPMRRGSRGASWTLNRYGGMTYSEHLQYPQLLSSTQVFPNRELWGIDASLSWDEKFIPMRDVARVFGSALKHYTEVAVDKLDLTPPLIVEGGAVRIKGFRIALSDEWNATDPIPQETIRARHTLETKEQEQVQRVLLAIYEEFFDAAGERRPNGFGES